MTDTLPREQDSASDPLGEELPVWSGSPSQWLNGVTFAVSVIAVVLIGVGARYVERPLVGLLAIVPIVFAVSRWLTLRATRFDVTTQRITSMTGVLSRRRRDMELYRVKDTSLTEPFWMRLLSLSTIEILASDKTTPVLVIPGVRDGEQVRQQIRGNVERMRLKRRVREMDMDVEH